LIELTDENTARGNELAAAVTALADAHDLVNRLRVGNNAEARAKAQVALENAIIAEAAAAEARHLSETMEAAATGQAMLPSINPIGLSGGEVESDPTACFKFAGTSFQGTCTFEFPVATFTAGVAPRFWQVGNTTQVDTHNFLSVACTPFMFQANQDGTIPIANLNGPGVTHANALHLTSVPACIFDISQVSAEGTVTCKYDFEKTMSIERGRDTTNNAEGTKFYVPGYTCALGRGEGIKSNVLADYNTNANLDAGNTAQDLRDIYGLKQFIGNRFPVPAGNLTFAEANGFATYTFLYDYIFATQSTISGLLFVTQGAYPAGGAGREYMFYVPTPAWGLGARVEYTVGGGGAYAAGRARITLSKPQCIRATDGAIVDFPWATLDAIQTANIGWNMMIIDEEFVQQNQLFGAGPFAEEIALTQSRGAVFQSRKRISQHVCGPILNPNMRIGAVAPLNYDSRHLPPELRDFRLQFYDIDWSRLQATSTTLNELSLYEFKDGTQKVGAEENVLYLPQFRELKRPVTDGTFDIEVYSELGCPSYFCLFCRSETTDILQQPTIKSLSLFNSTTKKKSNVVQDLSVSQLYHLTQRNVHPGAQYDRDAFRRRQTILLSAEDIGLLGLTADEYQTAKRVRYVFSGTTDKPGQLYIVMVYNNRGLHIDGRRLQVVTLHE